MNSRQSGQTSNLVMVTLSISSVSYMYILSLIQLSPFSSDDSWLNLDPKDLDSILQKSAVPLPNSHTGESSQVPGEGTKVKSTDDKELDLQSLVFGMKSFVDKVSTHKGAEFPW